MYDLVIRGGTVVDGTRKPPYPADVCVQDGKIAAIVPHFEGVAQQIIEAGGRAVAPGFVDLHTHSDVSPLLDLPFNAESKLFQGVTTEIAGNCGISIVPSCRERRAEMADFFQRALELSTEDVALDMDSVSDYARRVDEHGCAINYGMLIGHGSLRGAVMGFSDREPTTDELEAMKALLDAEMERGAFGLSLGLIYPPSAFGQIDELAELARVVARHDGILAVHMRSESVRIFQSVDEMLTVAERSGVHLQISHLKLIGKPQWGRAGELLNKIADARARGIHVTCDQYPYTATSTGLAALVPQWAQDGGFVKMVERLSDPEERLLGDIAIEMENRGGPATVFIASSHGMLPEIEGKTVEQIAGEWGLSAPEAVARMLVACKGGVACIYFTLDEGDVLTIMREMDIAIGSDGYSFSLNPAVTTTLPHPRSFGTFARFLQMVRQHRLMPLEDAVYKITGLPAQILGLTGRGTLSVGNVADLTVFDPDTVADRSEYVRPVAAPAGIYAVIVAGTPALLDGRQTPARAGRALLRGK